jgi:hypothetical protein
MARGVAAWLVAGQQLTIGAILIVAVLVDIWIRQGAVRLAAKSQQETCRKEARRCLTPALRSS